MFFSKNHISIYTYYLLHNNSIYGCYLDNLNDVSRISPLEGVDVSSFEVCKDTEYARDINRVYYPVLAVAIDGENYGYTYFKDYIVRRDWLFGLLSTTANPKTFKYINDGYAIDGITMYRYGKKVKWNWDILDNE